MNDESDWKLHEKVVAILERHLAPSAKVSRDVDLPVIKSSLGRTRQCDIVIIEGHEPRMTLSIVEVQKRQSKVDINTFNGWLEKLREVGAQHLICVSEAGYPSSVLEKADEIGPTVRLLTLTTLETLKHETLSSIFSTELELVRYDELTGLQMEGKHLMKIDPEAKNKNPDPHNKMFRLPDGREISATDFIDWHLFSKPENIKVLPKNQQITIGIKYEWGYGEGLQYKDFGGTWVPLKSLLIHIKLFVENHELSISIYQYEQLKWGEIGWALRGEASIKGKPFDIVIPVRKVSPGEYSFGRPITLGDYDAFIAIGNTGYKANLYTDVSDA
jgi:hypothetical protein